MKKVMFLLTILIVMIGCFTKEDKLINACINNNFTKLKTLIEEGANPNYVEYNMGFTVLTYAMLNGNTQIAEYLLSHGADVDFRCGTNVTALYYVSANGNLELVKFLINHGSNIKSDINSSAISIAAINGHTDLLKYFLEELGVDINRDFNPPLLISAADGNHLETVKYLVEKGANVNITNKDFNPITPLYMAVFKGDFNICKYFISEGADIKFRINSDSLLMIAIKENHFDVVKLLVENGADINYRNNSYETPLFYVPTSGKTKAQENIKIASYLIKKGADVNAKRDDSTTPLWNAVYFNYIKLVKLFIKNGANVNLTPSKGKYKGVTLLQLAKIKNYKEIEKILKKQVSLAKESSKNK